MNYQRLIVSGNVTGDAERRKSKKGDVTYTYFGVGVSGAKERTTFFPVAVFGKHGEAVAKYITKGCHVLVEGRIEVSDAGRFGVVADRVSLGASTEKPTKKPAKKA